MWALGPCVRIIYTFNYFNIYGMLESTKIDQSMPLTVNPVPCCSGWINRLLKGRFERFRPENTPVSTGGNYRKICVAHSAHNIMLRAGAANKAQ
ncbi:hypothetical protein ES707_22910 [subsurface metagenome]